MPFDCRRSLRVFIKAPAAEKMEFVVYDLSERFPTTCIADWEGSHLLSMCAGVCVCACRPRLSFLCSSLRSIYLHSDRASAAEFFLNCVTDVLCLCIHILFVAQGRSQ